MSPARPFGIIPVAFAALFALSASVDSILAQNLGANRHDRMRSTQGDSLKVFVMYVLIVWLILALGRTLIANAFGAQSDARRVPPCVCLRRRQGCGQGCQDLSFLYPSCEWLTNRAS